MSLRKRLSLIAAASVAFAVLIAVVVCYMVVRQQLRSQIDNTLSDQAQAILNGDVRLGGSQQFPGLRPSAGGPAPYAQAVLPNGTMFPEGMGNTALPVSPHTVQVATGNARSYTTDEEVGGSHLRVITFELPNATVIANGQETVENVAIELARPLNGVDTILSSLRLVLLLVLASGIAVAAGLGRVAARRVLAPLGEVANAAAHISQTEDLTSRLRVHADDEVGQLSKNFNAMLDRLEGSRAELDESVRAQRQLVADASHELRTPVTSLRTNIEVLLAGAELDPEDRRRLLADVVEQSEELSALVGDLIELARGDQPGQATEEVRLDGIAAESLARARRNAPHMRFRAGLEPVLVDGVPERLGRAINNLLDNATRHSPPGGPIDVQVGPEGIVVRDHGPGVDEEDQPYVFDRFFRGRNSRGRQGSGLGLAIVRQVAEQHGGGVSVTNAPDGGAVFTLRLPGIPSDPGSVAADPNEAHPTWTEPVQIS
jgi:two-component system sensor histidine kinase MprB